jgi:iron complex outermembrane receptor protein
MNLNINPNGNETKPENIAVFHVKDTLEYNNITWKLRFEYNLTPDNLLYASASTGFLPGDVRINSMPIVEFFPSFRVLGVEFSGMPMDEERVIAFEVGSKNQFLSNRLQVNGALFYYDYDAFRNPVNVSPIPMPFFATLDTPLRMIGAEIGTTWLITPEDKISFSAGYLDAKITEFPIHPFYGDTHDYLTFDRVENNPKWLVNVGYDHSFSFADGSVLVPRMSARWQSGMYLQNLTLQQYDLGYEPFVWQDSYMVADLGVTWISSSGMYSASGYIRNLFDKEYKNGLSSLGTRSTEGTGVRVGDPRVWGVNLTIRF